MDRRPFSVRTLWCARHSYTAQVALDGPTSCPYCDGRLGWGRTEGRFSHMLDLWRWRVPRCDEVSAEDDVPGLLTRMVAA
jgi:hypothetical protein